MIFFPNPGTRRDFLTGSGIGLGSIALADMLAKDAGAAESQDHGVLGEPHFAPEGQTYYLPFYVGCPVAAGLAGLQAAVEQNEWRAVA